MWTIQKFRLGVTQNEACVINRETPVINQNKDEEREYKELVCGSNEEKISVIIKTWINYSLDALKASSLFNLKS